MTALSGNETSALITPVTFVSADRTRPTHPTGQVIPVTFRLMVVSLAALAAGVGFEPGGTGSWAFWSWAKADTDSMTAVPMAKEVGSRIRLMAIGQRPGRQWQIT